MIELGRRLILGAALACSAGAALPGCTHRGTTKPPVLQPTPPPAPQVDPAAVPPKGQQVRLDLLLRPAPGARLQTVSGAPVDLFMAIQCCGGGGAILGDPNANTRWPLFSEGWADRTHEYGANAWHARLGPFFGDAENETEWADIGGPIRPDGTWNEAFWAKARALVWHAAQLNGRVEVNLIDTWYCKHAASNWGDQRMPWPQADIDACGITWTPTHERFVRKGVEELGGFGNVIWLVDNEGGEIRGAKRAWFEAAVAAVRRAEQEVGAGVVHMVGTNWPDVGDGPFDYIATHDRAPLTAPIAGKWTINNERNPTLGPENEAAYFEQARGKGLAWALWLADLQGEQVVRTFERFRDVARGAASAGCFPAPSEDPLWKGVDTVPIPGDLLAALARAKAAVGDRSGSWPACRPGESKDDCAPRRFEAMFGVLEEIATHMRAEGLCAGRSRDQVFVKANTDTARKWFEVHPLAVESGGWTGTPYKGNVWEYPQQ